MRAVTFSEFGGPIEVLEMDDPTPGDGQVLVAVEAASINPVDITVYSGRAKSPEGTKPPYIVGWDLAGRIVAVGDGVDNALIGSRVLGFNSWFASGRGVHASLVVLDADQYAVAPESIPPAELTTLGLNALTAYQVVKIAAPAVVDTVLVTGASGGVGGYVVEFASKAGASVWAMASDENADAVASFGATRHLPRGAVDAIAALGEEKADIAIDTASLGAAVLGAIRDGGKYFTVTQPVESERDIETRRVGVRANAEDLAAIVALAASGDLSIRVEKTFAADDAAEAFAFFQSGSHPGRVVLLF